jgi:UDP-N-acetylglucosamine:LPS N-acetylglucosamine transferase
MSASSKKLFITGGHLTPAIAVIDEIRLRNIPWEIVFIGRKIAMEGERYSV